MTWSDILADPCLQDLPYTIETNEYGQIVMSPASNEHGTFQSKLIRLLAKETDKGESLVEASIDTRKGVKVPDVAWMSDVFLQAHRGENPYSAAPELCIEVLSPSNSQRELQLKRQLYFEQGAVEVWECDLAGQMTFYTSGGQAASSVLFPAFPREIE